MKLRNKKTGEIKEWDFGNWYQTILNPENKEKYECNLNDFIDRTVKFREEWEDYEEEAEKAVERLRAWKRLKSCGFKFKGWRTADLGADKYYFVITAESDGAGKGDLDLLFGGKE